MAYEKKGVAAVNKQHTKKVNLNIFYNFLIIRFTKFLLFSIKRSKTLNFFLFKILICLF